jgi:hypothetical protein
MGVLFSDFLNDDGCMLYGFNLRNALARTPDVAPPL